MASEIRSYRDLIAWQKAMDLCCRVYTASSHFPRDERFGLISRLRRAAVSIPSNIAEGYGRGRLQDYLRFLRMARGSLYELQTQLTLAVQLGFASGDSVGSTADLASEVDRILCGLITAVGRNADEKEPR